MLVVFVATILIGMLLAPIGCIILWNRYTYLGDSLVHASIFSAAMHYIIGIPMEISAMLSCFLFFCITSLLKSEKHGNTETMYIASALLSSVAIILSPKSAERALIGDILFVNTVDILVFIGLLVFTYGFVKIYYHNIIKLAISRDIAIAHNIHLSWLEKALLLLSVFTISMSLSICGGLLITSILIVPAIIARSYANTPYKMVVLSVCVSIALNTVGLFISYVIDIPTTATISFLSCLVVLIVRSIRSH